MEKILKEIKFESDKSSKIVAQEAENKNIGMQLELAKRLLIGHYIKKDYKYASELLKNLSESSDKKIQGEALYILGRCYMENVFSDEQNNEVQNEKGIDLIKKSSALKNMDALLFLGNSYLYGINGVKKDINLADANIRKLANNGSHEAQLTLAKLYELGYEDIEPDMKEAIRWYQEATKGKIIEAFNRLGYIYFNSDVETDKKYEKSLYYWQEENKLKENEETKKMIGLTHLYIAKELLNEIKNKDQQTEEILTVLKNII